MSSNNRTLEECVDLEISYAPEYLREDAEYIALKREEIEKDIESLQKDYPYKTKGEILTMKYDNIKTYHEIKKNNFKDQYESCKNAHNTYNYSNTCNLPYGSMPGCTGLNYNSFTPSYSPFGYYKPSVFGEAFVAIRAILNDNRGLFICMNNNTGIYTSGEFIIDALFYSKELLNCLPLINDFCSKYNSDNPNDKICKIIVDKMSIGPTGGSFVLYEKEE